MRGSYPLVIPAPQLFNYILFQPSWRGVTCWDWLKPVPAKPPLLFYPSSSTSCEGPRGKLRALILSPTRELAEQTHTNIRMLGHETGLRSLTIYGGVNASPQIKGCGPGRRSQLPARGAY